MGSSSIHVLRKKRFNANISRADAERTTGSSHSSLVCYSFLSPHPYNQLKGLNLHNIRTGHRILTTDDQLAYVDRVDARGAWVTRKGKPKFHSFLGLKRETIFVVSK